VTKAPGSKEPGVSPSRRFQLVQFAIRLLIDRSCTTYRTNFSNDCFGLSLSMEPEILGVGSKGQSEQNDELHNVH